MFRAINHAASECGISSEELHDWLISIRKHSEDLNSTRTCINTSIPGSRNDLVDVVQRLEEVATTFKKAKRNHENTLVSNDVAWRRLD